MSERTAQAYAYCDATLRTDNRDAWLTCLFAPASCRPHLHALYLFATETGNLREKVRQPMAGEIRLQYWRDVIGGTDHGGSTGNPLALALLETIATCKLPVKPLEILLEARLFDLYDDAMPNVATLEAWCGETDSVVIRLACLILAKGEDPGGASAAGHAGVAQGITRILVDLPRSSARRQMYLPEDILTNAGLMAEDIRSARDTPAFRHCLKQMHHLARMHTAKARAELLPAILPAFLQLALVEPTLKLLEKPHYQPFSTLVELPQWRRQWAMWRMSLT